MTIQTTHNEQVCIYSEDSDKWTCSAYDLEAKSLSGLKAKINDFDAKERRLGKDGVALLYLDGFRSRAPQRVRATMLDKGIEEGSKYAAVWISGTEDKTRSKVGIHSLILDTPENIATLKESERISKDANDLLKKAEKMRSDIKRLTVEELKAMALEVKPE